MKSSIHLSAPTIVHCQTSSPGSSPANCQFQSRVQSRPESSPVQAPDPVQIVAAPPQAQPPRFALCSTRAEFHAYCTDCDREAGSVTRHSPARRDPVSGRLGAGVQGRASRARTVSFRIPVMSTHVRSKAVSKQASKQARFRQIMLMCRAVVPSPTSPDQTRFKLEPIQSPISAQPQAIRRQANCPHTLQLCRPSPPAGPAPHLSQCSHSPLPRPPRPPLSPPAQSKAPSSAPPFMSPAVESRERSSPPGPRLS